MIATEIEQIEQHATKIKNGEHDRVFPGMPLSMSRAMVAGDAIAQGDLLLVVHDAIPNEYVKIEHPQDADRQLVPGNTVGARHCLDSLEGIVLYRPTKWDEESFDGPFFQTTQERVVMHPTHGSVTVPGGMTIGCHYQKEFDAIQMRERRARD